MITKEDWEHHIVRDYDLREFDWFAIDRNWYPGVLSRVGIGYVPDSVKASYEDYLDIWETISSLPEISKAKQVSKGPGTYDDWLDYARKGLFAFDFQDIHRKEKTHRYDLLAKPLNYLPVQSMDIPQEIIEKIPVFDLSFPEVGEGILESDLRKLEFKK